MHPKDIPFRVLGVPRIRGLKVDPVIKKIWFNEGVERWGWGPNGGDDPSLYMKLQGKLQGVRYSVWGEVGDDLKWASLDEALRDLRERAREYLWDRDGGTFDQCQVLSLPLEWDRAKRLVEAVGKNVKDGEEFLRNVIAAKGAEHIHDWGPRIEYIANGTFLITELSNSVLKWGRAQRK